MRIKVDVTQECIGSGIPKSACNCPIALALKHALNRRDILVTGNIYLGSFDITLTYVLRNFIQSFDNGYKVEPFSFELEENNGTYTFVA